MLVAGKAEAGTKHPRLVGAVDMPFSLVADVLFLPHDIQRVRERGDSPDHSHYRAEQAVAPNRSLPPSQKSTSPVRGSKD